MVGDGGGGGDDNVYDDDGCVTDKIWDRKSFQVGGHWPLWRG